MGYVDVPSAEPPTKHVEQSDFVHEELIRSAGSVHELDDEISVDRPSDARQRSGGKGLPSLHGAPDIRGSELGHDPVDCAPDSMGGAFVAPLASTRHH
jgi:hypothetical protein